MSMTTNWHADAELMARYAAGVLDDARAYSVEAHLLACQACRALAAGAVRADSDDRPRLDRVWDDVVDRVDRPRAGLIERALVRMGVRSHLARLLAATPSLRLSWFGAEAFVLAFAVLAAYGSRGSPVSSGAGPSDFLFLALAPLLPLAGVAAAYGPGVDPTYEIGQAAPMQSFGLLLLRAVSVLAASITLAGLAALALPGIDWTAAAWLLPALGLTAASLALATAIPPLWAASWVTAAWLAVVTASAVPGHDHYLAFRAPAQIAFLTLTCVGALIVARRREAFERRSEM